MISHVVVILLLRSLLIFIEYPRTLSAVDFNYPIRNMSDYIAASNLKEFILKDKGNYTLITNSQNFIYVVSNGTDVLKLSKGALQIMDSFSSKSDCSQNEFCDQRRINLMSFNHENGILSFCIAVRSVLNNVFNDDNPVCYMFLEDSLSKNQGQWQGQTFTSSDFLHNTIVLTMSSYIYVGLHFFQNKQLHIFRNAQITASSSIPMKPIRSPEKFIKDPGQFILSFQNKQSIYFLLLETDFSCGYRNNQLLTRLLRICDGDNGSESNEFQALAKITVQCETKSIAPSSASYVFTVASAASWLPLSSSLVVSFVSKKNEAMASALCIYSIASIEEAFNSDIKKTFEKPSYNRNSFPNTCDNFTTKVSNNDIITNINTISKSYPLRRKILSNVTIFQEKNSRILHMSSDESIWTKYNRVVLFLGLEYRHQSAIIVMSLEPKFCILEKFLTTEKITTLDMKRYNDIPSLYIGTSQRLITLTMDRCGNYKTKDSCSAFLNPYCGWNGQFQLCVYIAKESELKYFSQTVNICPQVSTNSEEIISRSEITCPMFSVTNPLKQIGTCTCRLLNPVATRLSITTSKFCKVDGDWSNFSDWSDCSVTCGSGIQSRSRNCDSPLPRNDGSSCIGLKIEYRSCKSNIDCKREVDTVNQITQISQWSSWSSCSSTCGFSYRIRTRKCLSGQCNDELTESKLCVVPLCRSSITSEWSKWSKFNQREMTTRRLRVLCTEPYFYQPSSMTIGLLMGTNQTKTCNNNHCFERNERSALNGKLTLWSSWSPCSASCGVGIKVRSRQCSNNKCLGSATEFLRCNSHPCKSTWSCWSNWFGCSTICETPKTSTRYRHCLEDVFKNGCLGVSSEERDCDLIPCTASYTQWSIWSSCRTDGVMVRSRKCKSKRQCLLSLLQSKPCARASIEKTATYSSIYMIVSGIVGLLAGVLVASVICYLWWRCTILVIQKTQSGSLRISNPLQTEDIYNSQSLNTIPDTGSSVQRQRSTSNSDSYYQLRHLPQHREDPYDYSTAPTFFDYTAPYSALRQPLPGVQEL